METPSQIEIAPEVQLLLEDLAGEIGTFQSIGPISEATLAEIHREFLPERISDTLNIEGITVNPQITRAVLEGQTLSDADHYKERDVVNILAANDFITDLARRKTPINTSVVREIHRRVERGAPGDPGSFRKHGVTISGASFTPPEWANVPALVTKACELLESALSPDEPTRTLINAVWAHATIAAIHPFVDGNGRTARLIQDYVLLRGGLFPVGIPAGRRKEYYATLHKADNGVWGPLVGIVANAQVTTLSRARAIILAPAKRRQKIASLVRQVQSTQRRKHFYRFQVWTRQLEATISEFGRWVAELNLHDTPLSADLKVWDPLGFEKWAEIKEQGKASGTWCFTLSFSVQGQSILSFLFYAKRHDFSLTWDYDEGLNGAVGIFLTGSSPPTERFQFGTYADRYIALRELVFSDAQRLVAYRDAKAQGVAPPGVNSSVTIDRKHDDLWLPTEPTLADVCEEFLENVIFKLGLTA